MNFLNKYLVDSFVIVGRLGLNYATGNVITSLCAGLPYSHQ